MLRKLTLTQVWPAIFERYSRSLSVWEQQPRNQPVLLTDEWRILGDKDADTGGFLLLAVLSGEGAPFM